MFYTYVLLTSIPNTAQVHRDKTNISVTNLDILINTIFYYILRYILFKFR